MHFTIVAPLVVHVRPLKVIETGAAASWVSLETGTLSQPSFLDLFIAAPTYEVEASIRRAETRGVPVIAVAEPTGAANPVTGRNFWRGEIGPIDELGCDRASLIGATADFDTCLYAPSIIDIEDAAGVSQIFRDGVSRSCVTLEAGDAAERIHVMVPFPPHHLKGIIDQARIVRRPLVFYFGAHPGPLHRLTCAPIYIGHIEHLGAHGGQHA